MNDVVISVKNITKSFRLYQDRSVTLKERALFSKRNQYKVHEVLKGISFSVKRGEAIALIGKNGCGKSTTLKMLSRIMYPDSGTIEMKGRVSALIELGAGFHPDMTGRENIYINAAIFGLSRKEIDERLQDIIDFSELGEYIDSPVRTYSSGMYMRLAFSVAINVDADVLLIDEILAVGDAATAQAFRVAEGSVAARVEDHRGHPVRGRVELLQGRLVLHDDEVVPAEAEKGPLPVLARFQGGGFRFPQDLRLAVFGIEPDPALHVV